MTRHWLVLPALAIAALLLASCGRSSSPTTTVATTTTVGATTTTGVTTQDLVVTPAVREGLLDAAAAYLSLPASDFTGLKPAMTYYAFDPVTGRYYAAAGLVASAHSLSAQVATQDDGAYNLFVRTSGSAAWTVYNDGLGAAQDAVCPIAIPAAVLVAWNWRAHACYPPTGA